MKMIIQKFTIAEISSGESNSKDYNADEFAAIYELEDNEEFDLLDYINNKREGHKVEKQVIILPKANWEAIHDMMLRNYNITKKE